MLELLLSGAQFGSLSNVLLPLANGQPSTSTTSTQNQGVAFKTGMNASLVIGQYKFYGYGAISARDTIGTPSGLTFDASGDLWISDEQFNRVLEFAPPFSNGMNASVVIGEPDFTTYSSGCLGAATTTASSLCNPGGLAFDKDGNLWVADSENFRIVEFNPPFKSGMAASVVLGRDDFITNRNGPNAASATLFDAPYSLTFDKSGDLWFGGSSWIEEFRPPFSTGMNASAILGGVGYHNVRGYLTKPQAWDNVHGIAFDSSGNLWIAGSFGNNKVSEFKLPAELTSSSTPGPTSTTSTSTTSLRWINASITIGTVGELGCASNPPPVSASSFCNPTGFAFDSSGNVWVSDWSNARVLEFNAPQSTNMSASVVIGQANFTSRICGTRGNLPTARSLCYPNDVAFDKTGNLWVADGENRILRFGGAASPCTKNSGDSVPWIRQYDPRWNASRMGTSTPTKTIQQKGCAITSAAMLLSYLSNSSVSPRDLNNWLGNNSGYDDVITKGVNHGKYNLNWEKVAEYGRKVLNLHLYYNGSKSVRDDKTLDSYLRLDFPVLMGEPGHWVLATCRNVSVSGYGLNFTYNIRDPGHRDRPNLNNSAYQNSYQQLRLFSTVTPLSDGSITATAHSPVELSITDPLGRITGPSMTQIPNSDYMQDYNNYDNVETPVDPPVPALDLVMPMSGTYTLRVMGTGTGNYSVNFLVYDRIGNSYTVQINGTTNPGKVEVYQFDYSDSPGSRIHPVVGVSSPGFLPVLLTNYLAIGIIAAVVLLTVAVLSRRYRRLHVPRS